MYANLERRQSLPIARIVEANQMLQQANRRKDEFLAVLAHELRNPLAPIRQALLLLDQEALPEPARRAADVIGRQVHHLTRLVEDLFELSATASGQVALRRERVTLESVVRAGIEAAAPAVETARHELIVTLSGETVWLHVDPTRLVQVVANLLDNSAKYTPAGGRIVVDARRADAQATIRVLDNGTGIPAGDLPTLFDMFRRAGGDDGSPRGLGVGLWLARRLVELHGGTIEAISPGAGKGAEFVVRLPLALG